MFTISLRTVKGLVKQGTKLSMNSGVINLNKEISGGSICFKSLVPYIGQGAQSCHYRRKMAIRLELL